MVISFFAGLMLGVIVGGVYMDLYRDYLESSMYSEGFWKWLRYGRRVVEHD